MNVKSQRIAPPRIAEARRFQCVDARLAAQYSGLLHRKCGTPNHRAKRSTNSTKDLRHPAPVPSKANLHNHRAATTFAFRTFPGTEQNDRPAAAAMDTFRPRWRSPRRLFRPYYRLRCTTMLATNYGRNPSGSCIRVWHADIVHMRTPRTCTLLPLLGGAGPAEPSHVTRRLAALPGPSRKGENRVLADSIRFAR